MRIEQFDGVGCATEGDVALFLWKLPASYERNDFAAGVMQELAEQAPSGVIGVYIISPGASPPDAKVRADMIKRFKDLGPGLRRMIAVPVGDSLWTGVVRTLARGIFLLAGQGERIEVANTIQACLARIEELGSQHTPPRATLLDGVSALYARLGMTLPAELHESVGSGA